MGKAFPQLQTLQDFNSSCKNDWRITIFLIVSTPMKTTDANLYCEFTKHKLE